MRQILKTSTYAMMHFIVAVAVAYGLTRNWQIALGIGIIEPLVQTFAYAIHERAWERIPVVNQKQISKEIGPRQTIEALC